MSGAADDTPPPPSDPDAAPGAFREVFEEREPPIAEKDGADRSTINGQITDALAETLAAMTAGAAQGATFPQIVAQAAALSMLNAATAQQNAYITANATVLAIVARIQSGPNA